RITTAQARALVMASLNARQKRLASVALELLEAPSSKFLFFTATWAGIPGGSVVVENFVADPYTGDVFIAAAKCDEVKNERLRALQKQIRAGLHLTQAEYRRLKTKGPLCQQ
ncbi:MAG TPA: hypothetical protein VHX12_00615, partial [Acidisoma sp.]|nr:hypothetical protein [Acidisoma sp.]